MFCYHCPITASLGPHPHHHHLNPGTGSSHHHLQSGSVGSHVSSAASSALASLPSLYSVPSGSSCEYFEIEKFFQNSNETLVILQTVVIHPSLQAISLTMHSSEGNNGEIEQHSLSSNWKSWRRHLLRLIIPMSLLGKTSP